MTASVRMIRREHLFRAGDWTVRVAWVRLPGDSRTRQMYLVQEGPYVRLRTIDVARVRRAMGDDLYCQLTEAEL